MDGTNWPEKLGQIACHTILSWLQVLTKDENPLWPFFVHQHPGDGPTVILLRPSLAGLVLPC